MQIVDAVFQGGVFIPKQSVSLEEDAPVMLRLEARFAG